MIRLINVEKKFFPTSPRDEFIHVLKGVDLKINPGETVAICGPSGVGKSTLLHLVGLMEESTSGMIELFNIKTNQLDSNFRAELRNKYIGFLFQFHYLMSDFTVLENLSIPIWIRDGYSDNSAKSNLQTLLYRLGLEQFVNRYPDELSGGEQQRVALARALVNEPKLILADEPTGNLDKNNGDIVAELLFSEAKKRNAILVIATHNLDLANRADRIIYLQDGRIKNQ
jgi:lipoprotein-releasing system ATP-binding protein